MAKTNFQVEILNILGQTVYKTENEKAIDVSNFASGTYMLRIYLEENCIVKKLVVR